MARKERNDVDYFPFICQDGQKMFYIEEKYGNDGFATFVKLLRELAKTNYHYLNLSKKTTMMFLSAKCKVSVEVLESIILDLVELGKFNPMLWNDHKIIWCQDFIDSIQDAYKKRNNDCITFEGLLILLASLGVSIEPIVNLKGYGNTQRKEKDSKVEKKKEEIRENIEFIDNEKSTMLIENLIDQFGFREMRFNDKKSIIFAFVKLLDKGNQIDEFVDQLKNYFTYKNLSGEQMHGFRSLIGTRENRFEDGAWNSENWADKIQKFKSKSTPQKQGVNDIITTMNQVENPYPKPNE